MIPLLATLGSDNKGADNKGADNKSADNKNRVWQYGEIVSIKQDVFGDGDSTAYVYRLRAKDVTYMAAFASPLKASIHTTVRFAVEKKSLCVQDLDGKPRNAVIVEQVRNTPYR